MYRDGEDMVVVLRVAEMVRWAIRKDGKTRRVAVIPCELYITGIVGKWSCWLHAGRFRSDDIFRVGSVMEALTNTLELAKF